MASFYHGVTILVLIVFLLHRKGYFEFLSAYHLQDFSRYIFMLAIVWGYFWFAQFMLIWYGNIPEETVYYVKRWEAGWQTAFFLAEIAINWFIPFIVLLPAGPAGANRLFCGSDIPDHWTLHRPFYMQIMPGTTGKLLFGFIEIGTFMGFAGIFALTTGYCLSKAPLLPKNHPGSLKKSLEHHF